MHTIDQIYIDGAFVTPHGDERFALFNPATEEVIGTVRLADEEDTRRAIAAAKRAFPAFSQTTVAERIALLRRMHAAVAAREDDLFAAVLEEYGAPVTRGRWMTRHASSVFLDAIETLGHFDFERRIGTATVVMQPVGVAGLITPWNSNAGFICGKLAAAIAAGCTTVIKPSEMSAIQTKIVTDALHEAGLPPGVFNIL
ncbi:MAG: aldehyde dehydrogenase family protein, partial [Luteibacter sp.]